MIVGGTAITVWGGGIRIARLESEWFDQVRDPELLMQELRRTKARIDLFTFCQKIPETVPKYNYYVQHEDLAVITIESYDQWFKKQIGHGERKAVRKAVKSGVVVRIVEYGDELAEGVSSIFNETPVRQGRPYAHYGKNLQDVKSELSKNLDKCTFIGAYLEEELVGFIQLGFSGACAIPFGIVSKIKHRDKSPQTALIAKAIEVCAERGCSYLVYGSWLRGGIGDYKRRIGCVRASVPRYFVPMTMVGRIALKLKLYQGLASLLPERLVDRMVEARSRYYAMRHVSKE